MKKSKIRKELKASKKQLKKQKAIIKSHQKLLGDYEDLLKKFKKNIKRMEEAVVDLIHKDDISEAEFEAFMESFSEEIGEGADNEQEDNS